MRAVQTLKAREDRGAWEGGGWVQRHRGAKAAAWPRPCSLPRQPAGASLSFLPKVEPPELPEDLRHWIAYNQASSQQLRAESGLSDVVKDQ